jgi:hypothetical protein
MKILPPVLGIRIRRIRMFLGPPDLHPNLLVISTEPAPALALDPAPAPDPSIISKNS